MIALNMSQHMERALNRTRVATGASLAFGGPVGGGGKLLLEQFDGRTVGALPGLTLEPSEGLGGKVVALRRTVSIDDYFDTAVITHKYDNIIRAERLRSVVATPVIVGRRPVGVIYAAFRHSETVSGRIQDSLTHEARALEQELAISATSVDRSSTDVLAENARLRERIREVYRDLRLASASPSSSDVTAVLAKLTALLVDEEPDEVCTPLGLTERERDVLALAGSGMTNTQMAAVLGLTLHTVKGYMKSAMRKCGASTRLEAVVVARRASQIA